MHAHPLGQPTFAVPAHVAAADRLQRESAPEGRRQGQAERGAVDIAAEVIAADPATERRPARPGAGLARVDEALADWQPDSLGEVLGPLGVDEPGV